MRTFQIITNYRFTDYQKKKQSISADEMYLITYVEWASDHFGLGST